MVSTYTYFNFGVRSGVHLHIFQFWGPKWGPFTHISILGSEMVSIYTYFNFGVRNDVHLHIFQIWGPEMVFIYTYFKFGPRCGLNNPINRRDPFNFLDPMPKFGSMFSQAENLGPNLRPPLSFGPWQAL